MMIILVVHRQFSLKKRKQKQNPLRTVESMVYNLDTASDFLFFSTEYLSNTQKYDAWYGILQSRGIVNNQRGLTLVPIE